MLNWVVTFFLLAVVASIFGFGGMSGLFAELAQFIAIISVVLLIATSIYSMVSGKRPPRI